MTLELRIEEIKKQFNALPEARAKFYGRGYILPKLFLEKIESLRVRTIQEINYEHYLDEVASEYLVLKTAWLPALREQLNSNYRSAYIDMLAEMSPICENLRSLDPNFEIFLNMDVNARFEVMRLIKNQSQKEMESVLSEFSFPLFEKPENKLDCMIQLAESMGYELAKKIRKSENSIDFCASKSNSFFSEIRLTDLKSLTKHGHVLVHYFISGLPDKPFYLGSFVPYGNVYSESKNDVKSAVFGFYTQCVFLNDFESSLGNMENTN